MELIVGEEAIFSEHWALVTDHDSLSEEPVLMLWKDGIEDVEEKTEKLAVIKSVLNMSGNHCEAEYQGTTGRTVLCKVVLNEIKTKAHWTKIKELTTVTESLDSYYKI
jgi:hypothetical protein